MPEKEVTIYIDDKICKGCYYCVEVCPKKVLAKSKKLGPKGYIIVEAGKPNECIGCGACERVCPDFAISVREKQAARV